MFSGCGGLDFAFHKQSHAIDSYNKFKPTCEDIKNIPNLVIRNRCPNLC